MGHDARCAVKLNSGLSQQNQQSKRQKLFSPANYIEFNKLVKFYIEGIALYGAETLTLRKVDQNCLESSEMWCWRTMEKIT
jgi:hypothetical protein